MSSPDPKLVFVYNADSGLFEAMTDAIRKVVAPMTQNCSLCALTYQVAWMKPAWSSFINHIGIAVEFLHKDEFKKKYPDEVAEFPSAYIDRRGKLELFVDTDEMNSAKSLDELIKMVEEKLNAQDLG